MNQLSREKRKAIQISITRESELILESFTKKYGTPKSIVIERALQFLAAQYHRKIYLQYTICEEDNTTTTTTETKSLYQKTLDQHQEKYGVDEPMTQEEIDEWNQIVENIEAKKAAAKAKRG